MSRAQRGLARDAVPPAFDEAAASYDRLVGANPGYHKHLRATAYRMRLPARGVGLRLLDVGCGTGASTAALLDAYPNAEIVAIDASAGMLTVARTKRWPDTVRFVRTRAEDLHASGVRGPFDGIFAAYLLRNLADPDRQLRTFAGLLRPDAILAVHEYSVRDSPWARLVWHAVCWGVIIPAGWMCTSDATLYRYLWRSVEEFDGVRQFEKRFGEAGFADVHTEPMTGWQAGVVHSFLGRVPASPSDPATVRERG